MHRGALLLLFVIITATARSNDSPTVHGGSSIGYVRFTPPVSLSGVFGLPPQAPPYPASLGSSIDLHLGATLPLSPEWSVRGKLALRWNNITFQTTEPTVFNVNGTPTPGTFTHTLNHHWTSVIVGASVLYFPSPRFALAPSFDVEFPTTMSGTATETITDPPGITYTSGNTSRTRFDGTEQTQTSFALALQLRYTIPLSQQLALEPFFAIRQQLTSLTPNTTLLPTSLSIGFDLSVQLLPVPLRPTPSDSVQLLPVPLRPTPSDSAQLLPVPLRPTMPHYAPLFLATRLNVALRSSNSQPSTSVRILTKRRLLLTSRSASHTDVGAIGDLGIEPLRKMVDTVIDADPPRASITSTTIADAGFRNGMIDADVNGTPVWNTQWQYATDTTFTWELNTLPGEVLTADTLRIQLASTVVDNAGTAAQSLPRYVTLTRIHINTSASPNIPDFVDATFTADAFSGNTLTPSGKGLSTSLKASIQRKEEMEKRRSGKMGSEILVQVFGPEDRMRIVLEALGESSATTTINNLDHVRVLLIYR